MWQSLWASVKGLLGRKASPGGERRVWVRFPSGLETQCHPADTPVNERFRARVQDVSRGGARLLAGRSLEPGTQLLIELPPQNGCGPSTLLAYLAWVKPLPGGEYALGCTFAGELGPTELQTFGAELVRADAEDQRTYVRFVCDTPANYQLIKTRETQRWPAQVVNLSAGGVGLLVAQAVEPGTTLSLELYKRGEASVLTMLACVIRVNTLSGGKWLLGCNFIRELTDHELQACMPPGQQG